MGISVAMWTSQRYSDLLNIKAQPRSSFPLPPSLSPPPLPPSLMPTFSSAPPPSRFVTSLSPVAPSPPTQISPSAPFCSFPHRPPSSLSVYSLPPKHESVPPQIAHPISLRSLHQLQYGYSPPIHSLLFLISHPVVPPPVCMWVLPTHRYACFILMYIVPYPKDYNRKESISLSPTTSIVSLSV